MAQKRTHFAEPGDRFADVPADIKARVAAQLALERQGALSANPPAGKRASVATAGKGKGLADGRRQPTAGAPKQKKAAAAVHAIQQPPIASLPASSYPVFSSARALQLVPNKTAAAQTEGQVIQTLMQQYRQPAPRPTPPATAAVVHHSTGTSCGATFLSSTLQAFDLPPLPADITDERLAALRQQSADLFLRVQSLLLSSGPPTAPPPPDPPQPQQPLEERSLRPDPLPPAQSGAPQGAVPSLGKLEQGVAKLLHTHPSPGPTPEDPYLRLQALLYEIRAVSPQCSTATPSDGDLSRAAPPPYIHAFMSPLHPEDYALASHRTAPCNGARAWDSPQPSSQCLPSDRSAASPASSAWSVSTEEIERRLEHLRLQVEQEQQRQGLPLPEPSQHPGDLEHLLARVHSHVRSQQEELARLDAEVSELYPLPDTDRPPPTSLMTTSGTFCPQQGDPLPDSFGAEPQRPTRRDDRSPPDPPAGPPRSGDSGGPLDPETPLQRQWRIALSNRPASPSALNLLTLHLSQHDRVSRSSSRSSRSSQGARSRSRSRPRPPMHDAATDPPTPSFAAAGAPRPFPPAVSSATQTLDPGLPGEASPAAPPGPVMAPIVPGLSSDRGNPSPGPVAPIAPGLHPPLGDEALGSHVTPDEGLEVAVTGDEEEDWTSFQTAALEGSPPPLDSEPGLPAAADRSDDSLPPRRLDLDFSLSGAASGGPGPPGRAASNWERAGTFNEQSANSPHLTVLEELGSGPPSPDRSAPPGLSPSDLRGSQPSPDSPTATGAALSTSSSARSLLEMAARPSGSEGSLSPAAATQPPPSTTAAAGGPGPAAGAPQGNGHGNGHGRYQPAFRDDEVVHESSSEEDGAEQPPPRKAGGPGSPGPRGRPPRHGGPAAEAASAVGLARRIALFLGPRAEAGTVLLLLARWLRGGGGSGGRKGAQQGRPTPELAEPHPAEGLHVGCPPGAPESPSYPDSPEFHRPGALQRPLFPIPDLVVSTDSMDTPTTSLICPLSPVSTPKHINPMSPPAALSPRAAVSLAQRRALAMTADAQDSLVVPCLSPSSLHPCFSPPTSSHSSPTPDASASSSPSPPNVPQAEEPSPQSGASSATSGRRGLAGAEGRKLEAQAAELYVSFAFDVLRSWVEVGLLKVAGPRGFALPEALPAAVEARIRERVQTSNGVMAAFYSQCLGLIDKRLVLEGLREALQQYWEAQAPAHLSESPRLGGRAPGLDAALPRRRSRVASELETMAELEKFARQRMGQWMAYTPWQDLAWQQIAQWSPTHPRREMGREMALVADVVCGEIFSDLLSDTADAFRTFRLP